MSLFRSAFTVSSFTLGSRILGYIRDVMIAAFVGAGALSDAFFVAFRLPNFFRQISAEGAFNAAFIPLFSGKISIDGNEKAFAFAERSISWMCVILLLLTIIIEIFMPSVMLVLAPGFIDTPEQFDLAVLLARIMFPYLIFISLVALLSGMMQSFGKFAAAAAAPMLLSSSMIVALFFFADKGKTPVHILSYAVMFAGIIQWLMMWVAVRRIGFAFRLSFPRWNSDMSSLFKRMGPGIIGGGVMQLNVWVNTVIATTLVPGAVSYLYYADRLAQFPLALIGTAIGTALLPALSVQLKTNQRDSAIATQNRALEMGCLFAFPAAVALAILAEPIMALLFERGAFTASDTTASAAALSAYALGIPAFILVKIFIPSFFAAGDTKTPVIIAAICLVINITLNLILMQFMGHVGLALSTAISSWVNVSLLITILSKRKRYHANKHVMKRLSLIFLSACVMGAALIIARSMLEAYMQQSSLLLLVSVALLSLIGIIVFFTCTHVSKGFTLSEIKGSFRKAK